MKKLASLMAFALVSAPALAHPGHDHTGAPGGESHHLLWLGGVAVTMVVVGIVLSVKVRAKRERRRD